MRFLKPFHSAFKVTAVEHFLATTACTDKRQQAIRYPATDYASAYAYKGRGCLRVQQKRAGVCGHLSLTHLIVTGRFLGRGLYRRKGLGYLPPLKGSGYRLPGLSAMQSKGLATKCTLGLVRMWDKPKGMRHAKIKPWDITAVEITQGYGTVSGMDTTLQAAYGMEGGWARTPAKQKAARANGKKSDGRPRTRTLGEVIMRRKLKPADYRWGGPLFEAYVQLTQTEKGWFRQRYLRLDQRDRNAPDFRTLQYNNEGKPSATMRYVLRKMRLIAAPKLER